MKQYVAKKKNGALRSIEVFEADDHFGPAVALDMARIEGYEADAFLASGLGELVDCFEGYFFEPPPFPTATQKQAA